MQSDPVSIALTQVHCVVYARTFTLTYYPRYYHTHSCAGTVTHPIFRGYRTLCDLVAVAHPVFRGYRALCDTVAHPIFKGVPRRGRGRGGGGRASR